MDAGGIDVILPLSSLPSEPEPDSFRNSAFAFSKSNSAGGADVSCDGAEAPADLLGMDIASSDKLPDALGFLLSWAAEEVVVALVVVRDGAEPDSGFEDADKLGVEVRSDKMDFSFGRACLSS